MFRIENVSEINSGDVLPTNLARVTYCTHAGVKRETLEVNVLGHKQTGKCTFKNGVNNLFIYEFKRTTPLLNYILS